jgi:hypothetical protein
LRAIWRMLRSLFRGKQEETFLQIILSTKRAIGKNCSAASNGSQRPQLSGDIR